MQLPIFLIALQLHNTQLPIFLIALQHTELDIAKCLQWAYVCMHVARQVSEKGQPILMPDAAAKCHIDQNASRAYARMYSLISGTLV